MEAILKERKDSKNKQYKNNQLMYIGSVLFFMLILIFISSFMAISFLNEKINFPNLLITVAFFSIIFYFSSVVFIIKWINRQEYKGVLWWIILILAIIVYFDYFIIYTCFVSIFGEQKRTTDSIKQ